MTNNSSPIRVSNNKFDEICTRAYVEHDIEVMSDFRVKYAVLFLFFLTPTHPFDKQFAFAFQIHTTKDAAETADFVLNALSQLTKMQYENEEDKLGAKKSKVCAQLLSQQPNNQTEPYSLSTPPLNLSLRQQLMMEKKVFGCNSSRSCLGSALKRLEACIHIIQL